MPAIDIKEANDPLTDRVIGAAIEVHRTLGPGLLESVYTTAMEHELIARDIDVASEIYLPLTYKGATLNGRLRIDLLIEGDLVVELKAVDALLPVHHAQLLTYLRLGGFSRGLLINFNVPLLIDGIRRLVN
ncbi:MAG: GxxExxY protein [Gemmatimonadaceae bacterium]|nr:GxxExxY protein [Gemmatimonadaceae bacterium]